MTTHIDQFITGRKYLNDVNAETRSWYDCKFNGTYSRIAFYGIDGRRMAT